MTDLPVRALPKSDLPIIGVAMIKGDVMVALPRPFRHTHCVQYGHEVLGLELPIGKAGAAQGFYLADGTYLNRREAFLHAKRNGQPMADDANKYLFSEDVWDTPSADDELRQLEALKIVTQALESRLNGQAVVDGPTTFKQLVIQLAGPDADERLLDLAINALAGLFHNHDLRAR
ncbi:hypothetical protein KZ843_09655 [Pseudomonas aeruginosa]|nr:hypothetical protein [Pseudomonas aeruginosa]MBW6123150.1 hypothetical protein [Pseudomonas aeruginosa]